MNDQNVQSENKQKRISAETQAKVGKIISPIIAIIALIVLVINIFELDISKEARQVKASLKDIGCEVKVAKDSGDINDLLDVFDLPKGNVNEAVVAKDPDDDDIFVVVLFCNSIGIAEDCEDALISSGLRGELPRGFSVEREYKMVVVGHKDLVKAIKQR